MLYSSLSDYITDYKISLALIAEFFDHYSITVQKLHPDQKPEVATLISGVPGQIIPTKHEIVGVRCWTRQHAVANVIEKMRDLLIKSDFSNVVVYDNQEIIESRVGERYAYAGKITIHTFRLPDEMERTKSYRFS